MAENFGAARPRINWRTDGFLFLLLGLVASMVVLVQPHVRDARAVDNEINYTANSVWDSGYVDDATSSAISLPFSFNYFGTNFTQAVISSNGLLTLGSSGTTSFSNGVLPGAANNTIYAFWDDLIVTSVNGASQTTILHQTVGTAPNRKFIAQWTGIYFYNTSVQMGTFQVVLYETSNVVQIQYRNIVGTGRSQGNSATIGIQGSSSQTIQFLANTSSSLLVDGFALKYSPDGSSYTVTTGASYDPVYLIPSSGVESPVLSAPTDGATDVATTPALSWSAATNATGYKVYLSTNSQFSSLVANTPATVSGGSTTQWSPSTPLSNGVMYFWRVESLRNSLSSLSGTRTFTTSSVTKSAQSPLTVVPSSTSVGAGSTVSLSSSGGSGDGAVSYAIASGSAYCSVSGTTLTAISAGTCSVTATKATDSAYYSATSSAVSITVTAVVTRTVTYYGNENTAGSVPANGSGSSGSVFTVASNSGSLVRTGYTFGGWNTQSNGLGTTYATGTGTFTLNADTALYALWNPNTLTVTYDSQGGSAVASASTVTGGSLASAPAPPTWAGRVFNGWFAAVSGGSALSFPYAHGRTADFTLFARWLLVQDELTVSGAPQSLAYLGAATLSTAGGSGNGSVQFTSSTTSICSVNASTGSVSMLVGTGTCRITATKASDGTYASASSSVEISAVKANQSALVVSGSTNGVFSQSLSLTASGGSTSGALTWSSGSSTACSVNSSGSVSISSGTGTCSITATMAGNSNYVNVTSSEFVVSVSKAAQAALSVSTTSATFGITLTLTTSGGSGTGSVSYSVSSGSCNVLGSILTVGDAGSSCEVVATKAGDDDYLPVSSAATSISTAKATQSALTITSTSATFGRNLALTTSGGSGTGAVSFIVVSGTCSVNGSSLTPGNVGSSCVVKATKATDTNYNERSSSNTTITIGKANQTGLNVTSSSTFVTGSTLSLTAAGGQSTGALSWSLQSGSCVLSGTTLSANRGGIQCVVEVTRAGDNNYFADSATETISVTKIPQLLTFRSSPPASPVVGSTYTVTVDSDVSLAPTLVIANSSSTVCSISAGVVTFNSVGSCLISASQAGSDVYSAAAASQSVTVIAAPVVTTPPAQSAQSGMASATTTLPIATTTLPQTAVAAAPTTTAPAAQATPTTTTTTTTTTIPADPSKPILGADGEPVELGEGETTVLIRGEQVVVTTTQEEGQLVLKLPNDVVVRIGAKTPGGQSVQVGSDGVLRVYRNSQVAVELSGLVAGTTYTIFMFSTPIELGRGSVLANGAVSQLVTLPDLAEIGSHTLQVNGVGPGGEVVSVSMGIKVEKKQSNTAAAILAISAAILLALLGGRPVFARRRRDSQSHSV